MNRWPNNFRRPLALIGLLLVGCSARGPAPPEIACVGLATSYCDKLETCSPFLMTFFFGDRSGCTNYIEEHCGVSMAAPGTGLTSAITGACGRDIDGVSCPRFVAGDVAGTSCIPHGGAVRGGGECGDDWQCASGRCSIRDAVGCGVCSDPVAEGGACTGDECASGLTCVFIGPPVMVIGTCMAPFPVGGPCDSTRPCADGNVCQRATASSDQGTCQPARQAGQSCEPGVVACDYTQNVQCNPATKVCELPIATVQPGQPCGWIAGHYAFCNGVCALASPSEQIGACMALNPRIAEGQACGDDDTCALGTSCVGGICSLPDPSLCAAPGS